jgi:hypothetical protein
MIKDTTSSILDMIFRTSFLCMGRYQEAFPRGRSVPREVSFL